MKLVTALSTAAFETAPAICRKIQRAAAQGVSLAGDIADVFGASQTVMREIAALALCLRPLQRFMLKACSEEWSGAPRKEAGPQVHLVLSSEVPLAVLQAA
jgi:hypothetical protein